MDVKKDNLKSLLNFIEMLLTNENDDYFKNGLFEILSKNLPDQEISTHPIIKKIYEHCIEEIIIKQSIGFYKDFAISQLVNELAQDYRKMEHERRRDDFESFSICVYQQIENITNYLFDNFIINIWDNEKDNHSIKSYYNSQLKKYTHPDRLGRSIESLIFENSIDKKWYANRKFRAVLFYYYYNKDIVKDDYDFNSIYYKMEEVYQVRNQNHRGTKPSGYQLRTISKIKGNESKYYFKFYGFLEDFVRNVSDNLQREKSENNS